MGTQLNRQTPVTFTPEQHAAIEKAFADVPEAGRPSRSEMIRSLVASGLSLYQIEWPPDAPRGKGFPKGARKPARAKTRPQEA